MAGQVRLGTGDATRSHKTPVDFFLKLVKLKRALKSKV